jgi:hypothetical protein
MKPAIPRLSLLDKRSIINSIRIIDGAHILSPDVLSLANAAFRFFRTPFAATVSFHLGPNVQNLSILEGYNQEAEDELLRRADWKENGYRLYTVTRDYSDESGGWFGYLFESGCAIPQPTEWRRIGN